MPLHKAKFEPQEYVLKIDADKPESEQTKWQIRGLTVTHKSELADVILKEVKIGALLLAFKYGCVGWSNLTCDGEPVPFEGIVYSDGVSRVHPKFLSAIKGTEVELPWEWQAEIGRKIMELSGLEDSEKN